ncbi:MAG: formyl transferase [Sphingomonadales bacterium]|nr:formyl transferase [Sphingomonadales bacterium]
MFPRTDIWRVGILPAPIEDIIAHGISDAAPIWLPAGRAFTYLADPFGMWRDGRLHVFVETYDYRTRRGGIDVLTLDNRNEVVDQRPCLRKPWHLSYPFVFEDEGETFMLPEAHKSGALTLYRAERFPDVWTPVSDVVLDGGAVDATPVFFQGLWWIFYAPATDLYSKMSVLNAAYAPSVMGPWKSHVLNPLRDDPAGARPGGMPVVMGDTLVIPLQDCSKTYGGAVRMLTIRKLSPDIFEAEIALPMVGGDAFGRYVDGFHTLSACGPITLFDAKTIDRSIGKWRVDAGRAPVVIGKAVRRLLQGTT